MAALEHLRRAGKKPAELGDGGRRREVRLMVAQCSIEFEDHGLGIVAYRRESDRRFYAGGPPPERLYPQSRSAKVARHIGSTRR
jgi:hypothetical protein